MALRKDKVLVRQRGESRLPTPCRGVNPSDGGRSESKIMCSEGHTTLYSGITVILCRRSGCPPDVTIELEHGAEIPSTYLSYSPLCI